MPKRRFLSRSATSSQRSSSESPASGASRTCSTARCRSSRTLSSSPSLSSYVSVAVTCLLGVSWPGHYRDILDSTPDIYPGPALLDGCSRWHTPGLGGGKLRHGAGMPVANRLQRARDPFRQANLNRSPRLLLALQARGFLRLSPISWTRRWAWHGGACSI